MSIETITILGIGIQTLLYVLAGYALVIRHDESNKNLKAEVQGMHSQLQKLADVITQMAVQTVRVDNMSERITVLQRTVEELRRGAGWIAKQPRTEVDGEY